MINVMVLKESGFRVDVMTNFVNIIVPNDILDQYYHPDNHAKIIDKIYG
jgi:hypothetical protein